VAVAGFEPCMVASSGISDG